MKPSPFLQDDRSLKPDKWQTVVLYLPFALMAAQHRMGVKRRQMAMVGDQLYADRMAAALYGIPGLMVVPRGPDLGAQVILKRKWEKKHWQKYYDRGGRTL